MIRSYGLAIPLISMPVTYYAAEYVWEQHMPMAVKCSVRREVFTYGAVVVVAGSLARI